MYAVLLLSKSWNNALDIADPFGVQLFRWRYQITFSKCPTSRESAGEREGERGREIDKGHTEKAKELRGKAYMLPCGNAESLAFSRGYVEEALSKGPSIKRCYVCSPMKADVCILVNRLARAMLKKKAHTEEAGL